MRFPSRSAVLFAFLLAGSAPAADKAPQENATRILGTWQAGRVLAEFLPEGKVRLVERGAAKEGTYKIDGDWLSIRVEGQDERSVPVMFDGERMTVDGQEFRRARAIDAGGLIGKWNSDRANLELLADGAVRLLEKPEGGGKAGRLEIDGGTLRLFGDDGATDEKAFAIEGDSLVIDGSERLERVGEAGNPEMPLAGEWRHENGTVVTVTPDGRFSVGAGSPREGTYTLEGAAMTLRMADGEVRGFIVALEDGALVLDGELRFTRADAAPAEPVAKDDRHDASLVEARAPVTSPRPPAPDRFEGALDDFLEARKNLALMGIEGIGARHPTAVRAIAEARYLLKRCEEEAGLLDLPDPAARLRLRERIAFYRAAFEEELAEMGAR